MIFMLIYEVEFLGFSYGFWFRCSQYDVLDVLVYGIKGCNIWWIFDVDISCFFDMINYEWLVWFLEYCIGD